MKYLYLAYLRSLLGNTELLNIVIIFPLTTLEECYRFSWNLVWM